MFVQPVEGDVVEDVISRIVLGVLTFGIQRFHSWQLTVFGVYLLLLGINYVPLLVYAFSLVSDDSAFQEISGGLGDKRAAFRKYRRQSLFLLLPTFVLVIAIMQEIQRPRERSAEKQMV